MELPLLQRFERTGQVPGVEIQALTTPIFVACGHFTT